MVVAAAAGSGLTRIIVAVAAAAPGSAGEEVDLVVMVHLRDSVAGRLAPPPPRPIQSPRRPEIRHDMSPRLSGSLERERMIQGDDDEVCMRKEKKRGLLISQIVPSIYDIYNIRNEPTQRPPIPITIFYIHYIQENKILM